MHTNTRNLIVASLLALGTSAAARAADCSCDPAGNPATTLVGGTTSSGRNVQMLFPARPLTSSVRTANVCSDAPGTLTLAKLWMPDMGHGSAPTRLTAVSPTCTKVERVNFIMHGPWEIQIAFAEGDTAALRVTAE